MVVELNNFISKEECDYLIEVIEKDHTRSSVAGSGNQQSVYDESRTSSTCNLSDSDEKVSKIKKKIAAYLGLPISRGEPLQGQLYEPGQYFKPHHDYFTGDSYDNHCLSSGNRTTTFMVFLNEDMEGGETNFPDLNKKIKPEIGKAVTWDLMIDGEFQTDTLHEGSTINKGKKYIITSWWRENDWNGGEDTRLAQAKYDTKVIDSNTSNKKIITSVEDFPRFTPGGFNVIKTPERAWNIIQEVYNLVRHTGVREDFEYKENSIPTGDSEILNLEQVRTIRGIIHEELKGVHEQWSGTSLIPSFVYGIRSYTKDATLSSHVDRIATHHISSIIIVDKDLNCGCKQTVGGEHDWALDVQDHDGTWHKVYADIGDMILYESATCQHGRLDPFKGNFFRNFYVHYKLNDWEYAG